VPGTSVDTHTYIHTYTHTHACARYVRPILELDNLKDACQEDVGLFVSTDLVFAGFKPTPDAVMVARDAARIITEAVKRDDSLTYLQACTMKKDQMLVRFRPSSVAAHAATTEVMAPDIIRSNSPHTLFYTLSYSFSYTPSYTLSH
jgi:hypothetical protein